MRAALPKKLALSLILLLTFGPEPMTSPQKSAPLTSGRQVCGAIYLLELPYQSGQSEDVRETLSCPFSVLSPLLSPALLIPSWSFPESTSLTKWVYPNPVSGSAFEEPDL